MHYENGREGLAAIETLQSILGEYTDYTYSMRHPIGAKLLRASPEDYQWNIQFAKKITLFSTIYGADKVLARLDKPTEVYQALTEIEVALKLKIAGLNISFIEQSPTEQRPDLVVEANSQEYNILVIPLNTPEHDIQLNDFYFVIINNLIKARKPILYGGVITKALKDAELKLFLQKLKEKVNEALEKDQIIIVNEEGYVTIGIAPEHLQESLPEEYANGFRFSPITARVVEERIVDIITKKKTHLDLKQFKQHPNILVIHNHTSGWKPEEILKNAGPTIDPLLGTSTNLIGLILITQQRWWRTGETPRKETLENKILVTQAPAIQESEATLIWPNPQTNKSIPERIIEAFTDYQPHLEEFFA